MVRTSKFTTPEEKLQAKKDRSRRYEHSSRGRATRNGAHRLAYHKRTSRKGPTNPPVCYELPAKINHLAAEPLPTSDLFKSALQDADLVDESQLDQWDQVPPYPVSSDHEFSPLYIKNLVDVMHGRRLREHRRAEDQRIERIETYGSLRGLRKIIASVFEAEMGVWDESQRWIEDNGHLDTNSVSYIMASHHLQWTARKAKALHEELETLAQGMEAYRNLLNSRKSIHSTM